MTWAGLAWGRAGGGRGKLEWNWSALKNHTVDHLHPPPHYSCWTHLHFLHIFNIYPPCTMPAVVESWRWCLATRCRPSVPGITPAHLSRPHPAPPPAPAPVSSNRKFIISGLNCPQIPTVHHHHHQPAQRCGGGSNPTFSFLVWIFWMTLFCCGWLQKIKKKMMMISEQLNKRLFSCTNLPGIWKPECRMQWLSSTAALQLDYDLITAPVPLFMMKVQPSCGSKLQ